MASLDTAYRSLLATVVTWDAPGPPRWNAHTQGLKCVLARALHDRGHLELTDRDAWVVVDRITPRGRAFLAAGRDPGGRV